MTGDPTAKNALRPVGAVSSAVRILRRLGGLSAGVGVTAIGRATRVNTSTCFNILRTLVQEGLVVFEPKGKTYRLGVGVIEIAAGLLGKNQVDLIRPELQRLALNYDALLCLWHVTDSERTGLDMAGAVVLDHEGQPAMASVLF
jgi:DNA-binding IclR family transcriptional regulator